MYFLPGKQRTYSRLLNVSLREKFFARQLGLDFGGAGEAGTAATVPDKSPRVLAGFLTCSASTTASNSGSPD